jgi:YVTN family beta-propeller protein
MKPITLFNLTNKPTCDIFWGLLIAITLLPSAGQAKSLETSTPLNIQVNVKPAPDNMLQLSISQNNRVIGGLKPRAWLQLRRSEQVAAETSCEAKIKSFISGQLASRADLDLNSYTLITLNQDKTVTFIDPQVVWSSSKLQGIVPLPAQGLDWVLSKDGKSLYVTLPELSAVAIINTVERRLSQTISTGEGTKPGRIALSPNGRIVWVGLDNSDKIAVLSEDKQLRVNFVETGAGLHQIAFTPDSKFALITNSQADTVSIINAANLQKITDITVGKTPLEAVWLNKAQQFYVPSINDGTLTVIDPVTQKITAKLGISRGVVAAAADSEGRYLWLVNQPEAKAYVIDSATNQRIAFVQLPADPDQITFTADFAYFRSVGSEKFTLVNRKQIDTLSHRISPSANKDLPELASTTIQAGEKPPSLRPETIGVASMIAPLPENNSVMVANAVSQTLYYYVEGMMVPMGTLDNYRRSPRGLLVLDRSLHETAPGLFVAPVNLEKSGNYDVAVLLDQPRSAHCFTAKLKAHAVTQAVETAKSPITLHMLPLAKPPVAGQPALLTFTLHDEINNTAHQGVNDARLLAFEPPGLWQKRLWLQETSPGIYQTRIIFPHTGQFNVLVEAKSQGLQFTGQALNVITVTAAQ